jgi:hypothetical protein
MTADADDRRRGTPSGGGRSKPARSSGRDGGGRAAQPGRGQGAKGQGAKGRGRGGGGPRRDRPSGDNDTIAQLEGPLSKVLARLPATQRQVLELRMGLTDGHPHDLADTARALGLSLSETKDIEQRAFAHIREVVPLQQLQRFLPK